MRMLLNVRIPNEPFSSLVLDGTAGAVIAQILDEIKPEAVYFTDKDGARGGVIVVDVASASDIPRIVEPFFLKLDAECDFRVAMTPEDLQKAGLDAIGAKWK